SSGGAAAAALAAPAPAATAPPLDPAVEEAVRLARTGHGDAAVTRLRELHQRRPDDAQIPFVLGRVSAHLRRPRAMIAADRDAIRLDPSLRETPELIGDLIDLLGSRTAWPLAAEALEQDVGAAAVPAVDDAAAHHKSPTVRARAAEVRARL